MKKKKKKKRILVTRLSSNCTWQMFDRYRVTNIILPEKIEVITLFTPRDL